MNCLSENYQLKWHSFGSYLHSSVAASMCNGNDTSSSSSSFTDVVLLTIDGHQFLAHRFILSACSQYLNEILKTHSKMNTTLPLLIVLPPEITYKTLRILIQYMYSGEATVSKDILENVLRGGDLLKVKGLWRPREEESEKLIKLHGGKQRGAKYAEKRSTTTTTSTAQQQQQQQQRVAEHRSNQSQSHAEQDNQIKQHNQQHHAHPNNDRPFSVLKSTRAEELAINNNNRSKSNENRHSQRKLVADHEQRCVTKTARSSSSFCGDVSSSAASTSSVQDARDNNHDDDVDEDESNAAEQLLIIKEEPIDWTEENVDDELDGCPNFDEQMTIKAEVLIDDRKDLDADELAHNNGDSKDEIYSPLTCELCSETFAQPAEWVRHIQTHTDMMPAKRQRRGKSSTEDDPNAGGGTFPPLHCDMCQEYYSTPAEWVHHIQNTHTEFELRLSNKNSGNNATTTTTTTKSTSRVPPPPPPPLVKAVRATSASLTAQQQSGHTPKICTVCNKKFPSHASMLIHKRTHTGERPYTCKFCGKGFNVKSNLLRHLRTLHDKIINSTEVDLKEDNSSNNSTDNNA